MNHLQKLNIIYVVTFIDWEDFEVIGIYTDLGVAEKVKAYLNSSRESKHHHVKKFHLDQLPEGMES